ncbi:MAG TPA: hypothetical protein VF350_06065 [Candidatus Bathyarchaeia archaeon]
MSGIDEETRTRIVKLEKKVEALELMFKSLSEQITVYNPGDGSQHS